MSETIQTDICIIGAGPAGAMTSLFLSKMGISHIIVDAATFPRDKVCGDGLDLKVMRVLNHYDPTLVEREIIPNENFVKSWGVRVIQAKNKYNDILIQNRQLPYPFFFLAKRGYFDHFLTQKIPSPHARFMQGTKVTGLKKAENGWEITASEGEKTFLLKSKLIVGADGDHSVVLRSLGQRKIEREHYAAALRQYWKGISGMKEDGVMELYLPPSLPMAYLWIFPLPNGEANVGCGLISHILAKKKIDLKKLFNQLLTEDPALAERFKNATPLEKPVGWGLPLASQRREAAGDGYLLVGDAAGLITPTTGEGVGPGMMSGYIAAHFIKRALEQNRFDESVFANYTREISKRLESDIRKYNFIKSLSPYLYNIIIKRASALKIADKYINKKIDGWIKTAREKEIEIEF